MRFAKLQLIRYGRFADCNLVFPSGDCDLQIILGPNEAGKSTTLSAVSDLLFGFPARTRFGFKFDQRLLRVGAVIEAGGESLEMRRRKGNVDTLLGADDAPLDANLLRPHLGGQTRETFERMFGLNHAALRAGGKLIVEAKDDVGAAIFAAGSGLLQVTRVCEQLDAEAAAIWARTAGDSRRYTAALSAYQAAKVTLKEVEVRPTAWAKAKRELEGVEAELAQRKAARADLQTAQRTIQRKQLVLGPQAERQLALAKLVELGDAPELSAEATTRLEAAIDAAQSARTEINLAQSELERLQRDVETIRPSEAVLAAAQEADALKELKGIVDDGETRLPALEAELAAVRRRTETAVTEIGWPAEPPEAVKARLPGRPTIAELRDLVDRRRVIDEQARAAGEAVAEAAAAADRLRGDADALPARTDVGPLQILLGELRASGLTQTRQQAEKDRAELERLLASHLRALVPWRGGAPALRALPPIAEEDADHVLSQIESARTVLASATQACDREAARLEQLRLERRHAALDHPTPTLEDLDASREARSEAWAPLRAQLRGESELHDPVASLDIYEAKVLGADRLADERFVGAEHAGGLAAKEREIEKAELQLQLAERGRSRAGSELLAAESAFNELMGALGVALSPEAYPAWRDARDTALQHADGLDIATAALEAALDAEFTARLALHQALGRTDGEPASLQQLLSEAEQIIAAASAALAQERELQGKLAAAEDAYQRALQQRERAKAADVAWKETWTSALARAVLPTETSLPAVRTRLDLIDAVRVDLDSLLDLQNRVEAIGATREEFERRLNAVALQSSLVTSDGLSTTYPALQSACRDALSRAARVKGLEADIAAATTRREKAIEALARAKSDLSPLLSASGGAEDTAALRRVLARWAEVARLRTRVEELECRIVGHGEGRALDALLEEVAGLEPDSLAAEAEEVAAQLDEINPKMDELSETRRAALMAFEALDDRADAAIAAAAMAGARSEMAFQADLYIRKRAEARLLRTVVERYRQEKQAPLLTRASSLFATLTLGAFGGLMVDYEDDTPRLVGVRADRETLVSVDGMSDGTVDQLYLALRIAAVEDAVAQGFRLPFVADDLFINFDDERSAAGFRVLAELARKTQVLFFTHHSHLAAVAHNALAPAKVSVCGLERDTVQTSMTAPTTG